MRTAAAHAVRAMRRQRRTRLRLSLGAQSVDGRCIHPDLGRRRRSQEAAHFAQGRLFMLTLGAASQVAFHLGPYLGRQPSVDEFRQCRTNLGAIHGVISSGP